MTEQLDFRISSGLKNIIGKELITSDLIAIFELVKNSYDANATEVKIVFENIKKNDKNTHPRILVIDDGDGMSYRDINEKWLFVGYSEKKEFEKQLDDKDFRNKIGNRRVFAGAKGIGRFSCDKLGKYLDLYTKKENENIIHYIHTDWGKFEENSKEEFQTIKVEYDQLQKLNIINNKEEFSSGAFLEISSLNSEWDRRKLLKLKKYLQRLINPSQVGDEQDFNVKLIASEFQEEDEKNKNKGDFEVVNGQIKNIVFEKLGIKTTEINCHVDPEGKKIHTKLTDRGTFLFNLEEKNPYPALKNINIRLFYLNPVAKTTFSKVMGLRPKQFGSIFLYKNGFRVHPYGDDGDDWLGLEVRKGQGYARFLGTREVMGRIEINGYQPNLREVSSRDGGLEKTYEYEQLINFFTEKVLRRLERYVVEGIDWDKDESVKSVEDIKLDSLEIISKFAGQIKDSDKKVEFNPELLEIVKEKQIEKLPQMIKNLESLKKSVTDKEEEIYIDTQLKSFKHSFDELMKSKNKIEKEKVIQVKSLKDEVKKKNSEIIQKEKQILFLTSITGEDEKDILGMQHHIGLLTSTIDNYLYGLKRRLSKGETIPEEDLVGLIDKISFEVHKINSITDFVTKANFDPMTENIRKDLVSFIKQYIENVYIPTKKSTPSGWNINVQFVFEDDFEFIYKFKPLEIIIVLDNLLSNSKKANASKLWITFSSSEENMMDIKIKDNGRGVPDDKIENIFEFGYTTTDGSGIGLYHVSKVIEKMGGSISVNNPIDEGIEFVLRVIK